MHQPEKPPETAPAPTVAQVRPKLAGSIRIADVKSVKVEQPHLQAEVVPMTQENLEQYWNETANELSLQELMSGATIQLGEHAGMIEITAQTVSFHDDFKPHRVAVMEHLRKKSGMPMLDCKVTPKFIQENSLPYQADEKYNAMLRINPHMAELRKVLPQIDM